MEETAIGQDIADYKDTEQTFVSKCKDAWDESDVSSCTLSSYGMGTGASCRFDAVCLGTNNAGERVSKETSWEGPLGDAKDLVNCNGALKVEDEC